MAYYSLHAYDADVRIPLFAGLKQDDDIANDLRFAIDLENVETPNGVLQPQAEMTQMSGEFTDKVETIARFHRRWYTGDGSNEWLVCASGGKLYCRQVDDNRGWFEIAMPEGVDAFESNAWSWITYEINQAGVDHPIDVLIMSNAKDGMMMVIPPDRPVEWGDIYTGSGDTGDTWGDLYDPETPDAGLTWGEVYSEKRASGSTEKWEIEDITPEIDDEKVKCGGIERHKERIWGTAIENDPDKIMYSALYDPTDWEANTEIPEDGAGDILQPTWDGDKFTALKTFGDQLIAFKGSHVWRVMGVGPGEYTFTEQYGGGTLFPDTVCVDVDKIFMVEKDGISVYDGMSVSPFRRPYIEKFWRTVNRAAMDQMCAAIYKDRYYISVPTGDSTVNDTLVVFNMVDGSFLLYKDIYIENLMTDGSALYATTSTEPGKVYEVNYDSWETGLSEGKHARWETPWMDFNYKTISKGGYEIYFNPEVRGAPVTFRFTIQTEKKSKSKVVVIQPTISQTKQKRIRFGGTSRRFKLIVEVLQHPHTAVWRLTGGIHMVVETDPD